MARNGEVPSILSKIHEKFETPVYSILLSGLIMAVLASTIDISGLASLGSFCVLFTHIFTNYSALRLYKFSSKYSTSFRVPLRPLHSIIGLIMSAILAFSLGVNVVLIGIFACLAGFTWYVAYARILKKNNV